MNALIKTIFFCFVISLLSIPVFSQTTTHEDHNDAGIVTDGKTGVVTNVIELNDKRKVFTVADVESGKTLVSIPSELCHITNGSHVIYHELTGKANNKGKGKNNVKSKRCEVVGLCE